VSLSAKAAIIRGGETRREISAPRCRAIPKSTNFSPGKFAGIWESTNRKTRTENGREQAHHREPERPRRQGHDAGGVEGEIMNEKLNFQNEPQAFNQTDQPAPSLRYGRIWFFNALATGLAISFFISTDMGTSEFFYDSKGLDWDSLIFLAIPSFFLSMCAIGTGTAIFFATKRILQKKALNLTASRWWLYGPAWTFALGVFFYSVWNITPQQRLAKVCRGTSITAHNIKVVGARGMQMGEWLAVFEAKEDDFRELVRKQQLQPDSETNFTEKLDRAVMLRRTSLYVNLPTVTNAQCFKWEYIGVDGYLHGGVYASFDPKTSRAVVYSDGY
jgi:hypothetical protein